MKGTPSIALLALVLASTPARAFQTSVPAGSGIVAIGAHPEPRNDPRPLVAHFPLTNFLSFELDFRTTTMDLTFDQGIVTFYDEQAMPYRQETFGAVEFDQFATRLDSNPQGSGANIPAGERIIFFFPYELLGHNEVPSTIDVAFCFLELAGPGNACVDPLLFLDIPLYEYRQPPGQTYVYPTTAPAVPGEAWWSGGAHELGVPNGHRRGGLRRSGNAAWVNQRYAYDIAVKQGGAAGPECDDGSGNSGTACNQNPHYFCWGEAIVAPADGEVVLLVAGKPDNPEPLCEARMDCSQCTSYGPAMPPRCPFAPGAGGCNNQPNAGLCGASDPCAPGAFPGSGNQVVLLHGNGEYTTFAHMMQGSNDHLSCNQVVQQGDLLGQMGMTGTGSNPHMHFSSLTTPGPEAAVAENTPMYFTNVEFATPGQPTPRRQLDTSIPGRTLLTRILAPPVPLPRNAPSPAGAVNEAEPNDVLAQHHALTLPATVSAVLEDADVGDLAVRGDAIEDVYRFDLAQPGSIRVDLVPAPTTQNLDVYALTEDLRVLNETRQGTRRTGPERLCLELGAGATYLMVTSVDPLRSGDVGYTLSLASDPQTIAVAVTNAVQPVPVDGSCEAVVEFAVTLHDNCCLDPDDLGLGVTATSPAGLATLGAPVLDPPTVLDGRNVVVTGRVTVESIDGCPAVVAIAAHARDCSGNDVSTAAQGSGGSVQVVDATAPLVVAPPDQVVECDAVPPPGSPAVADNCTALPAVVLAEATLPGNCPGNYTLVRTWTATDACGNVAQDSQTITVQDTTPPAIVEVTDDLFCLWPPDHRMVELTAARFAPSITDSCSEPVTWTFDGCPADQPDDAPDPASPGWNGDGATTGDCRVAASGQAFSVRAERAGRGPTAPSGRRYGVEITATDACGNTSAPVAIGRVHVPHDQHPRASGCIRP